MPDNIKQQSSPLFEYLFGPRYHFSRFQFNLIAIVFLSAGLVVGSYFSLKGIAKIFATNDTKKEWTLNTANQADFSFDSNLMAVDDTGAHPISTANKITNPSFNSNTTGWEVSAVPPSGWVEVPANATYSLDNFLVMKYEAKCAATDALTVGLTTPADTSINVYRDDGVRTPANNCTSANGRQIVSLPSGYPVTYVDQTEAADRCESVSLGSGTAHLITNQEWMAIARNVEVQDVNWSLGAVGSGYLFAGHNDSSPAKVLVASSTDTGDYRCAYTESSGAVEAPSGCPTHTANGKSDDAGNQVRTLSLSNGSVVWDMSGNVWEWTSDTILGKNQPTGSSPGWAWREFSALTTYGSLTADDVMPVNSSYDNTEGLGQIYTDGTASNELTWAIIRGAYMDYAYHAGIYTTAMSVYPTDLGDQFGFRCTSSGLGITQTYGAGSGVSSGGGNTVSVGTVADAVLTQSVAVGDTSTYDFSAYVYDSTSGNVGGTVSSSVAELYFNGSALTTTYTDASSTKGAGWWRLSGTLTGVATAADYGLLVKMGKTIKVDDITLSKQGSYAVYTTTAYSNDQVETWDSFCPGTLSGSTCTTDATQSGGASIKYQLCTDDGSVCESGNSWQYYNGSSWATASNTTTHTNTAAELTQTAMQLLPIVSQKISVKAIFTFEGDSATSTFPSLPHVSIGLTTDSTLPPTQATAAKFRHSSSSSTEYPNSDSNPPWTSSLSPYFSWTEGADDDGGSGMRGYCLYLGQDIDATPNQDSNLLSSANSPISTIGTNPPCLFIVSSTSADFSSANSSWRGATWLTSSADPYYLKVWAVDVAGNVQTTNPARVTFKVDNTPPTNVSYISPASGNFSSVADMNFSWPVTGSPASSDTASTLLGWQYQINSTAGEWQGTASSSALGISYIPTGSSTYTLTVDRDAANIITGNNVVYFRSVDVAGNFSSDATIRTGNLSYGGAAPSFGDTDVVTVSPSTTDTNSFSLSWPEATAAAGQSISAYYYMVNTAPPSTLATLTGNSSTYMTTTSTSVSAASLPGVNKGTNTVYVVAVDDADTPNYSPSNYITGTFTLNSTDPDNVGNLVTSDSSIKSQSQWNVTLTWTEPTYKGAGNLTYYVYRSEDGTAFSSVGSTSGLSYVDSVPSSKLYYYKVYTEDGASARSSGTNAVSITPTGKWTSAPSLSTGPSVSSITTKKATVSWTTSRSSDSKIAYGTTSNTYLSDEVSNSTQTSSHSVNLSNLTAGTTYYYKAKWTDEDGNTGTSEEKTFQTQAAPTVKDVKAKNIGLSNAILEFTVSGASKVKIYYGKTTGYGGQKEISTSTSETTYTTELTGLEDGTKYYYKINAFDSESSEYEGTILDFTTVARPKISSVRLEQVANTAQTTIRATWTTNTEVSSIITFYPENDTGSSRDEVKLALEKGPHSMIIRGLLPETNYVLLVRGRDKLGNEATSESFRFTTATDTRPPQVLGLKVLGGTIPPVGFAAGEVKAQLVVTWDTDEPATSQVEFGPGTETSYPQKSQEDANLTTNHTVILSNLTPSQVYQLRVVSKDKAGNETKSPGMVTIAPKATKSALDLVVKNLSEAFSFVGGIKLP